VKNQTETLALALAVIGLLLSAGSSVFANGGPFVLKYPNGDPAAKGIPARLDPDLKPAWETRLRVIKEDLKVTFGKDGTSKSNATMPPLVCVLAEYTIENPTGKEVEIDFGFPILRGVYISPYSMMPRPDVQVRLGQKVVKSTIISNSAIYGIIRQRAREVIERAVAGDAALKGLIASVRDAEGEAREAAHKALGSYLLDVMRWNERDAALMVEYASLDFGKIRSQPLDRSHTGLWWGPDKELNKLMNENLGPLSAIGEQKATQFFAQLASRFEPKVTAAYEAIFTAWGGDVRERSVDLKTGNVRPREVTVDPKALNKKPSPFTSVFDPTVYARVDYLDPRANISESEKASCKAILKNLPVVFTFAPMNILHYQVKFPAESTQTLTVTYSQYAYSDTRSPSSYQLAYVVHPASLWKEFGPINLEVAVPEGVSFRASVPCSNGGTEERPIYSRSSQKGRFNIYQAVLKQKTGELYLAVDAETWKKSGRQVVAGSSSGNVQHLTQKVVKQQRKR